ncbi:hypothetical protein FACS189490_04900 [Clostridia bacterium]|nr:hypothetical protein FACS189490_04900 [Clostridia bacterium]
MIMNRIAIASTDGKTVHQHFGRAKEFHIVELTGEGYIFSETREVTPSCDKFEHGEHSFGDTWERISDCRAVLVGKIGQPAADYLIAKGMRVFETTGVISEILEKIISEKLL